MTLNEAREVLRGATWARETPLIALFDEVVERYNTPIIDREGKEWPSKITRVFAGYKRAYVSSGRIVQQLISLRLQYGMPLHELES